MEDATRAARARNRQKIAMIVMAVVGAGSLVVAVYNAAGHRWLSMTGNLLVLVGMALGLVAQRQMNKHGSARYRPS